MIDKRLKAAASYVRHGNCCVDVGTDHGYLAVYLYESGVTKNIIACDINEKPLKAACTTIEQHGLEGKIKLVLSNGLCNIPRCHAQDIIICGMGGELIMQIISECGYSKEEDIRFILQPMTNVDYLRCELYKNGYEILSETPILDNSHCYSIMLVRFCGISVEMSACFCAVGKIPLNNSDDSKAYIKRQAYKQKKIANGLRKSVDKADDAVKHENLCEELLSILEG